MAVRMKDIAESLGVSIVTVSKALRSHPDIAKDTRQRVLDKAEELHYRPNLMARSLVTGRSSLIGMVVPDLVHPFFAEIAKSLSAALRGNGLFLIVCSSEGDPLLEQAEIEQMLALRPDALIVASSRVHAGLLTRVKADGPPLILIDRTLNGLNTHFVGSDDYRIGQLATEHLISLGRQRVAHIRGPENNVGNLRFAGYRDALTRHGIEQNLQHVVLSTGDVDADGESRGSKAMAHLLAAEPRPDAVFCFNDLIAMGAITYALETGIRVPEEIAFIGCGNYYYSRILQVPLSSIDQRVEEIGRKLARVVFSLAEAKGPQRQRKILVEPLLVIRTSTAGKTPPLLKVSAVAAVAPKRRPVQSKR